MDVADGFPKPVKSVTLTEAQLASDFVHNLTSKAGARIFRFAKTPPMPTYLLAMAVHTFQHVEVIDRNNVLIRLLPFSK